MFSSPKAGPPFYVSRQPATHFANLSITLFSVLIVELENMEAQMLSGSGKLCGLMYSAWQRFRGLISDSFYSCDKYFLIIYYVPITGVTEVNAQSGR